MRSVHNTYLTLPVLFIMISNHYPVTYGTPNGWIVLAIVAAAGVAVRRFFVLSHKHRYVVGLPAAAIVLLVAAAIVSAPRAPSAVAAGGTGTVSYAQAGPIVARRCAACHAAKPSQPGFSAPPQGVLLDTPANVHANAARIEQQAVRTRAMPLGNVTHMTDAERAMLGAWIAGGAKI
jgi:uncharacterized membrane protein